MTPNKKIKACAYLRWSTDDQTTSLDIQEKRLCELAEHENYEIIEWFVDEGKSGSRKTEKRTDWLKLIASAATAEWEVILCFNRSRFSRLDCIEEGEPKQILRQAGKRLHTAIEGKVDWDSSAGRVIDVVHAEASNQYAATIGNNTLEGKLKAFLDGKGYGQKCPYGMARRIVDNAGQEHIVPRTDNFIRPKGWSQSFIPGDPDEIEVVRWLFNTFAAKDVGYRWLARQLNANNTPAPDGGKWCAAIVGRLLRNDTYVGDTRLGKRIVGKFSCLKGDKVVKREYGKREQRTHGGLVRQGTHEGIIDRELWDLVQAKIKRNTMQLRHLARGEGGYALKDILFCGHCGYALYGLRNQGEKKSGFVSYVCKSAVQYGNECGCAQWTIREKDILPLIINKLTEAIDMRLLEKNSVQPPRADKIDGKDPTARLERRRAQLQRQIDHGTARLIDPDFRVELTQEMQAKIAERIAERDRVIEEIKRLKVEAPNVASALHEWQKWMAAVGKKLIPVQTSPVAGTKLAPGLKFTPDTFRETLLRFGCRVFCYWKQRSARRYDPVRVRILLGLNEVRLGAVTEVPASSGQKDSAQIETNKSVYIPNGAAIIDITVNVTGMFPDPSYPKILPIVRKMRANGSTMKEIANHLNSKGWTTVTGTPWNKDKVWNVLVGKHRRKHRRPYSGNSPD